mgnify:CR=1 FL=1
MNYYYLIASLPGVDLDAPPPLPPDEFRSICGEHLSRSDFDALTALLDNSNPDRENSFVREWREFDSALRNTIARVRAGKLNMDPSEHTRQDIGYDPSVEKAVSAAFSIDNPLEREKSIDRLRWERLNELAGFDPFAARALLAYTLKLLLAKRWSDLNRDKGADRSENIINRDPED